MSDETVEIPVAVAASTGKPAATLAAKKKATKQAGTTKLAPKAGAAAAAARKRAAPVNGASAAKRQKIGAVAGATGKKPKPKRPPPPHWPDPSVPSSTTLSGYCKKVVLNRRTVFRYSKFKALMQGIIWEKYGDHALFSIDAYHICHQALEMYLRHRYNQGRQIMMGVCSNRATFAAYFLKASRAVSQSELGNRQRPTYILPELADKVAKKKGGAAPPRNKGSKAAVAKPVGAGLKRAAAPGAAASTVKKKGAVAAGIKKRPVAAKVNGLAAAAAAAVDASAAATQEVSLPPL